MRHLVQIQSEFMKESRSWDRLTLEQQKGYLKRHPKSKRRLTAKPLEEEEKHYLTDFKFGRDAVRRAKQMGREAIEYYEEEEKVDDNDVEAVVDDVIDAVILGIRERDSVDEADSFSNLEEETRDMVRGIIVKTLKKKKMYAEAAHVGIQKQARKWDDLTYEEQKGYLSRHPLSKRRITARPGGAPAAAPSEPSAPAPPNPDQLYDDLKSTPPNKLQRKIEQLKKKQESIYRRGMRASRRYEDAGPLDIAREKMDDLQEEIDVMEAALTGRPADEEIYRKLGRIQHRKQWADKIEKQFMGDPADAEKYLGKKVFWTSRKTGREESGRAISISYRGRTPRVKTDTGWSVPVAMITRSEEASAEEQRKVRVSPRSLIGKQITWKSGRKTLRLGQPTSGRVVRAGPSKVKTDNGWSIPLGLIETADGQPFSEWITPT